MTNNSTYSRNLPLQIVIATSCITLASVAWLDRTEVTGANAFLSVAAVMASILLLLTLAVAAWQRVRSRAKARWVAALDAFAEREIAREKRWKELKRSQTFSTATGISEKLIRTKNSGSLAT